MGAGRHGAAATPWERDRAEFAALMERLGSDDEQTRLNARLDLERFPYEDAVHHLAALWPEEERKRRRRARLRLQIYAAQFLTILLLILAVCATSARPELRPVKYGMMFLWAGLKFAGILPMLSQKRLNGMYHALPGLPDVRLTGAFIDALAGDPLLLDAEAKATLRAKLADLLPRHRDADLPPLDAHQRKVLLREVRAAAKRLRRKADREMPDDRARFLVAALDALGWEALRAGTDADAPTAARDAEAAQREVDRMAQALEQVPDAARIRNLREVRDAAEECLVRLRL